MQSWKVCMCEEGYFSNTRCILFMKPGEKHTAALRKTEKNHADLTVYEDPHQP